MECAAVVDEVRRLFGADNAAVACFGPDGAATLVAGRGQDVEAMPVGTRWEIDDSSAPTAVLRTGRAARVDQDASIDRSGPILDDPRRLGIRSAVAAPISVEGHLWGVMVVSTKGEPLPPDTERRMANFTDLVATATANAKARAELAASRARIVAASDETRRRIERDLHDGIQQRLVSIGLELRGAEFAVPPEMQELQRQMSQVAAELDGVLDDVREISRGIHPAILSQGGLGPALRALARRSAVPVELSARVDGRLPERIEAAAYYVVSEALTNAAKHAPASVVRIDVEVRHGALHLVVRDDGVGGADPARGSGLIGLVDRVEALDGKITVSSPVGGGTSISIELPVKGS